MCFVEQLLVFLSLCLHLRMLILNLESLLLSLQVLFSAVVLTLAINPNLNFCCQSQHTPRPHTHPSIPSLRSALRTIGQDIVENGTPTALGPFVIGLTGYVAAHPN